MNIDKQHAYWHECLSKILPPDLTKVTAGGDPPGVLEKFRDVLKNAVCRNVHVETLIKYRGLPNRNRLTDGIFFLYYRARSGHDEIRLGVIRVVTPVSMENIVKIPWSGNPSVSKYGNTPPLPPANASAADSLETFTR